MTTVNVNIRNEATGEMEKLRLSLRRLHGDVKKRTPVGKDAVKRLENTAFHVSREFRLAIGYAGASAGLAGGTFVASLASIGTALDNLARENLKQFAVVREVSGLTYKQFERFVVAAKARGLSDQQARKGVENMARGLRNLELGIRSTTRAKFGGEGGANKSGLDMADQLRASLQQNGLNATMNEVFRRMSDSANEGSDNSRWIAQTFGEVLGIEGAAWYGVADTLHKIKDVIEPSENNSQKFVITFRSLQISLSNFTKRLLGVIIPVFTKFKKILSEKLFTEENRKNFVAMIKYIVEGFEKMDWARLRAEINEILSYVGHGMEGILTVLADVVVGLDWFFQWVNRMRGELIWNAENRRKVPFLMDPAQVPFSSEWWQNQQPIIVPNATPQRFSQGISLELADDKLEHQTELLTFELRRFVDVLRDLRGGAGGGSSDGGVSRIARTRPMKTPAGGAGGPGGEQQPSGPVPPGVTADPKKQIYPGFPLPGRHSVKGSWFGQHPTTSENTSARGSAIPGGWVDKGDMDKFGRSLGNWGGYSQQTPGVAIPFSGAAGRAGKQEGRYVRVWDPNKIGPGVRSHLVPVVDVGPNQVRTDSKDKGIDVNAPLAEQMGYAPNAATARATGRPVFPTGKKFDYKVINPDEMLRTMTEMDQERRRASGLEVPWKRAGKTQMNMEVNVNGPRSAKVDARLDEGELGDEGVRINREMTD